MSKHIHIHLTRDADPALEAKVRQALMDARNKWQHLHYERVDIEKRARQLRKAGDANEAGAWAFAQKVSLAEREALDRYKQLQNEAKRMGLRL